MHLNPYLNFNGNCREVINFYSEVFDTKPAQIMTFGDMPESPEYPLSEEVKSLIIHTNMNICGVAVMFSDVFPDMPLTIGNNISLAIVINDEQKIRTLFKRLKSGGTVEMELQQTEWSKCYGSVYDKFGILWQLNQQDD